MTYFITTPWQIFGLIPITHDVLGEMTTNMYCLVEATPEKNQYIQL